MRRHYYQLFGVLAIAALTLAVISSMGSSTVATDTDPTAVPHFRTADIRVQIIDEALESRNQDPVWVQLDYGAIPEDVTHLTVLTDEDCTPDADGVSHCLNRVEFKTASGTQQAGLRHHHNMAIEPCLSPGQTLELVR